MTVTVGGLFRYPLKAAHRQELSAAEVLPTGIAGDREYMLVDAEGGLLTQREVPALATLDPERVIAASQATGEFGPVRVWGWDGLGEDQGDTAAQIVSERTGRPVRVMRFPRRHRRPTSVGGGETMYADGFPLLIASTASLGEVNRWLDEPVPMERFRPSIVLEGLAEPFVEDDIAAIQIGEVFIELVKLAGRCAVTTVDQDTGEKGREPLRALGMRRVLPQLGGGQEIMFAVNAIPRTTGTIRLGDEVSVTMHEVPYELRINR